MNIKANKKHVKSVKMPKLIAKTPGGELELWETKPDYGYSYNIMSNKKSDEMELGVFLTRGIIWEFV